MMGKDSDNPLVSIIIPVYNSAEYLEDSILSITNQTYKNIEILIADDCSTDDSFEIIKKLAEKDSRIKVFQNTANLRIVRTLNFLMTKVHGEYIARMDSDDISLPKRIERQVRYLQKHPKIMICGTNINYMDENGKLMKKAHFPISNKEIQGCKYYRTPFCHPTVMFRSNIKDKFVYKDEYIYAEDYGLWLELLNNYEAVNIRGNNFNYRIHKNQTTKLHNDVQIKSLSKIYRENLKSKLDEDEIVQLCEFVVLRKIKDKRSFIHITKKISKISSKLTIKQFISLFFNILMCK